jgi:hypothetical protein
MCQRLGVDRNISTAYHPQTDGLSERKNQWVEQYLRFVTSAAQDDWSDWLAIATAVHNHYPNTTTRIAPIRALMGYTPKLTPELPYPPTTNQLVDDQTKQATEKREQAKAALNKAAQTTLTVTTQAFNHSLYFLFIYDNWNWVLHVLQLGKGWLEGLV